MLRRLPVKKRKQKLLRLNYKIMQAKPKYLGINYRELRARPNK